MQVSPEVVLLRSIFPDTDPELLADVLTSERGDVASAMYAHARPFRASHPGAPLLTLRPPLRAARTRPRSERMLELSGSGSRVDAAAAQARHQLEQEQIAKDAALAMMLQSEETQPPQDERAPMDVGTYLSLLRSNPGMADAQGDWRKHAYDTALRARDPGALSAMARSLQRVTEMIGDPLELEPGEDEAPTAWTFARREDDDDDVAGDSAQSGDAPERVLKGGAASLTARRAASGRGNTGLHRRQAWQPASIPVD